jgi:hypothetical protein
MTVVFWVGLVLELWWGFDQLKLPQYYWADVHSGGSKHLPIGRLLALANTQHTNIPTMMELFASSAAWFL